MLIFDRFGGDDTALAWRQQDVTAAALSLIATVCARHYRNACRIAGALAEEWEADDPAGHRRLTDAHDILAAAWRWEVSPPHPRLALDPPTHPVDAVDWLRWLDAELRRWHDDPDLVLWVRFMLRSRDDDAEAAALLADALRDRYASVPWHDRPEE